MSDSKIKVRPYHAEDKFALLQIVEQVYGHIVQKRYAMLWDWWQNRNCLAIEERYRPTVVQREGVVVGFSGMQPRRFKIGSQELEGGFILDNFSSPEARGVGIALFRHLIESTELILGAPVSRANTLWKKLFGKDDIDVFHVRKGVRIIDPSAFLKVGKRTLLVHPIRWIWSCVEFTLGLLSPRIPGARLESVERFPSAIDELCNRWASMQTNSALRDQSYLNWRFSDSPIAYEKTLLWDGNTLAGFCVFRIGIMNGRRALLLVEILAHHRNLRGAYGSLLAHAVKYAREHGATDVQTFDSGCSALRWSMQRSGFFLKPESLALIGHFRHDKSDSCPIYKTQDWFISAGDSDFEFAYFNQGWESLEAVRV